MWESPVLWVVGESVLEFAVGFRAGGGDSVGEGLGAPPYQAVAQAAPTPPEPTSWTLETGRQAGAALSGKRCSWGGSPGPGHR